MLHGTKERERHGLTTSAKVPKTNHGVKRVFFFPVRSLHGKTGGRAGVPVLASACGCRV